MIKKIEQLLEKEGIGESLKDELKLVLKDAKRYQKRLDKIVSHSDKQEVKLRVLNKELNEYKNHLEDKVEEEIKKREEKERMLLQQSKLAAMGEMIDAVAHQWKQPINVIKIQVDLLGYDYEDGYVNQEYVNEFQRKFFSQVEHMNDTLNEFRSFFRPNKNLEEFSAKNMVKKVLLLVKDEFLKNMITVDINDKEDFSILAIENEFKHLVLNIINNAKDAFVENEIENRKIDINIFRDDEFKYIEFEDNAGGIPSHIIPDIFKANVTSKAEGKGTGIGLYMSSQIAQKYNAKLNVTNINNGAKFIFKQKIVK